MLNCQSLHTITHPPAPTHVAATTCACPSTSAAAAASSANICSHMPPAAIPTPPLPLPPPLPPRGSPPLPPLLPLLPPLPPPTLPLFAAAASASCCRSFAACCPGAVAAASASSVTERSAGVTCDMCECQCEWIVVRARAGCVSNTHKVSKSNTHTHSTIYSAAALTERSNTRLFLASPIYTTPHTYLCRLPHPHNLDS